LHAKRATNFGGWNTYDVKRFNDQCEFVVKGHEKNIGFDIDYHETMKIQSNKATKTANTLVPYDELEKAFAEV